MNLTRTAVSAITLSILLSSAAHAATPVPAPAISSQTVMDILKAHPEELADIVREGHAIKRLRALEEQWDRDIIPGT